MGLPSQSPLCGPRRVGRAIGQPVGRTHDDQSIQPANVCGQRVALMQAARIESMAVPGQGGAKPVGTRDGTVFDDKNGHRHSVWTECLRGRLHVHIAFGPLRLEGDVFQPRFGDMLAMLLLAGALSQPTGLSDADIGASIDLLKTAIVQRHRQDRHWDPRTMPSGESSNQLEGGYTALACLSLVTAGTPWHVEPLRGAIETLRQGKGKGTYTVALRVLLFAQLPEQFLDAMRRDARLLIESFDEAHAGWAYRCTGQGAGGRPSPSVRHMAVLALRAAANRGMQVPDTVPTTVAVQLLREQRPDGGWGYAPTGGATGSMTAAAVASLLLSLHRTAPPDGLDQAVQRGMAWLDANYASLPPPGGGRSARFPMYWLYALERTAMATGRRTLAEQDWFRTAAQAVRERLLRATFDAVKGVEGAANLRQMCFGLLLLHRGRVPLAANVLVADADAPPSRLPGDLVSAIQRQTEQASAWQVVTLDDPIEVWMEAPLLLIHGDVGALDEAQLTSRLSAFIDAGGMVVFASSGGTLVQVAGRVMATVCPKQRWRKAPPGTMPRGIISGRTRQPIRADLLYANGRLVAWLLMDRASRSRGRGSAAAGRHSTSLVDTLLDAWGTATELAPFPPRLDRRLTAPSPPLSHPIEVRWVATPRPLTMPFRPASRGAPIPLLIACSDPDQASASWAMATHAAGLGRPVLLTSPGGDRDVTAALLAASRQRPRPWWPQAAPSPRWRLWSRRHRPDRAMDLPMLVTRPSGSQGGIVICPCDVLHALSGRPAWGVHGLSIASARMVLAGLEQLQETCDGEPLASKRPAPVAALDSSRGVADRRRDGRGAAAQQ